MSNPALPALAINALRPAVAGEPIESRGQLRFSSDELRDDFATYIGAGGGSGSGGALRAISASIPSDASSVTVTFSPAFSAQPTIGGLIVLKADSADPEILVAGIHSLSESAVTVELSAAAPLDSYSLHGSVRGPGSSAGGQFFTAAIPDGASSVAVTFSPAFSAPPTIGGLVVLKSDTAAPEIMVAGIHSLTTDGVTVALTAAAPLGTYILHGSAQ